MHPLDKFRKIEFSPKASMGKPPKDYSKIKSIGVFCCFDKDSGCPEIYRFTYKKGDIYIFPILATEGSIDFHISHHASGKFHWTVHKKHIKPRDKENDFRNGFKLYLRLQQPCCYCFRKGKNLSINEIREIINVLKDYIPFKFNEDEAIQTLNDKGHCMY
jgi:hypothetical protein